MNRCDFSSISTCLKNHISESNQMSQPDFLYELFEDFMDDPANQDFSMDNGLVCRWMTGQAKISPKISAYYSKPYCTLPLKEIEDTNALLQLASVFYSEADTYRTTVEKIIETVHSHTFAVELAAKLLENGISTPDQLLTRLQVEKASFHNEDKIKIIKDGQSSKATYYSHIHTLFSLYTLSLKQQDIMCNMCFLPSTGISARIFAKWLELPTLNEINDLIETGFVQTTKRRTISLHPMIQEITLSETKPSVTRCHILLDSLQHICLMHGMEVDYYKKLFQTIGNIIVLIEKDDIPKYLLFLENAFPYMDNYNYHKGMNGIIQELTGLLKTKNIGTIYLMTANLSHAKTHFKKAFKIYEKIWADESEMIEAKYREIQELYPQIGFCIGKNLSGLLTKQA